MEKRYFAGEVYVTVRISLFEEAPTKEEAIKKMQYAAEFRLKPADLEMQGMTVEDVQEFIKKA